ncbi:MAG: TIGR04282 family arsenosugar biosynthesis glycosyltransferase [Calothrix sp. MO_192.B10]|nr:TIGR04282 family arsenosugar biosynthesis glycosyltransferase [Calothrix sp. MO_192.B10]
MLNSSQINKQHLIVFTRYPEPGKTKTRLITALGAEGAANLQRQMTEHTLSQVKKLQTITPTSVEIRFADGNLQLMQTWLGDDLLYQSQGAGDLGQRMARSLLDALQGGAQRIVFIGIDCPGVNADILTTAFQQLDSYDLVIGPAIDGGYYLIGLKQYIPELFANIDWGTAMVWQQTIDIAQQLNLSQAQLLPLADVDRPEDLPIWESR